MMQVKRKSGEYQKLGSSSHFIPYHLPPKAPDFQISSGMMTLYGEASFALGQLNEMSQRLPDLERFVKAYITKEALLSSAIEGIQTTLIDVLTVSATDSKPNKDTQLVMNYSKSVSVALELIKELPLAIRVILEAHRVLLSSGEGDKSAPGCFRKQTVKVGGLVPPPAQAIPDLMKALERYINEPSELPDLIRIGLVHVQFETIHPFLDGNGRIGRLLIVLMLIYNKLLDSPILYPSYYFKKNHMEYYHCLDIVRKKGDFEAWIMFYLNGIKESALDAHFRAREIESLERDLLVEINTNSAYSKIIGTSGLVLQYLFSNPITSISEVSVGIDKSYNTVSKIFKVLAEGNIIKEATAFKRNKIFRFERYLSLLDKV